MYFHKIRNTLPCWLDLKSRQLDESELICVCKRAMTNTYNTKHSKKEMDETSLSMIEVHRNYINFIQTAATWPTMAPTLKQRSPFLAKEVYIHICHHLRPF